MHHKSIIYNKPTRCNSGSIVFINNYKYALHVSVSVVDNRSDRVVTFWPWNSAVLTDLDIYTGFIPSHLMTNTSDCHYITVYSAPEDGRKGRPKHVEHTCSF